MSKKAKILIVEDDPDQREILKMVLLDAGYEVFTASGALKGLELARNVSPDLILSDLMMPEMDGADLFIALREDMVLRDIPFMILTVVSDSDKELQLLELGVSEYCEKSIQRKILLKRIERIIKRND